MLCLILFTHLYTSDTKICHNIGNYTKSVNNDIHMASKLAQGHHWQIKPNYQHCTPACSQHSPVLLESN